MGTEIERKWVVRIKSFEDLHPFLIQHNISKSRISQFYTENYHDVECRLRKEDFNGVVLYTMTEKIGKGLVRTENEVKITEIMYQSILGMYEMVNKTMQRNSNIITKTRYCYVFDDDTIPSIYFDTYSTPTFIPFIIEVEFKHKSEAERYDIESTLQQIQFPFQDLFEVTDRKDFKNSAISNNGFPFYQYVKHPFLHGENNGFVIVYKNDLNDIYLEPHVNDRVLHAIEYYNNSETYINSYLKKYNIPLQKADFEFDLARLTP